jgi:uncharacterized membrane protein
MVIAVQRRAYRSGGQVEAIRVIRQLEWTDDWVFTPAPLLVVATGVAMVLMSDAWAFSQPWVYVTLALIAVEFIVGSRDIKRLRTGREHGDESPELGRALAGYFRFAPAALAMLAVIVVLMVLKLGS